MTEPLYQIQGFSDFAQWRNKNIGLDSRNFGLTVGDVDQIFFYDESEQWMVMFLEVKSRGKKTVETSQKNIYLLLDSVFRTVAGKVLPLKLWGKIVDRKIRYMGRHLLVMSGTRPDNSEWMLWDGKPTTEQELVRTLRFELDPNTLRPLKLRPVR